MTAAHANMSSSLVIITWRGVELSRDTLGKQRAPAEGATNARDTHVARASNIALIMYVIGRICLSRPPHTSDC